MSLAGNLKTMPFADLLQFLEANQSTGTLQIQRGSVIKMIFWEKGKIISSSSSDPKEYLGHFLVSRGLINEDELRVAMDIQRNSKMLLGKILVVGGKVTEEQVTALLKLKAEETVFSLFLWQEGEFRFYENEFITRLFIRISINPQSLIFEGVLRKDEWQRIRKAFPHNHVILEKVPSTYLDGDEADAAMLSALNLIDGQRTIEDIVLGMHSVDFPICRALHQLYEKDVIRIKKILEPPAEPAVNTSQINVKQLLGHGSEAMQKGRYEEAVELLRQISQTEDGYQKEIAPRLQEAEKHAIAQIYANSISPTRVLKLRIPINQIEFSRLTPQEGFLLSRIDGSWDVNSILAVTPMNEYDALRLLKKLLDQRIIA